jgi:hypothetical protein
VAQTVNRLGHIVRDGSPLTHWTSVPTWVDVVALSANTAKDYELKPGAVLIRLTPDVIPCYGSVTGPAVLPTVDVSDGSASFPVGAQTYVVIDHGAVDADLSLICASAATVTIEVWN